MAEYEAYFVVLVSVCSLVTGATVKYTTIATPTSTILAPVIKTRNMSPNKTVGDTASLSCWAGKATSDIVYQFWRGDTLVATKGTNEYDMHDLKESDSGIYWCSVVSRQGKIKSYNNVTITVTKDWNLNRTIAHAPSPTTALPLSLPTLVLHKPLSFFYQGSGAHFTCEAPGYGDESYYELVKDGRVVKQHKGRDFFLQNLRLTDTGLYSCGVLLVYRKSNSRNSVYLEVMPDSGTGDGDYIGSASFVQASPSLITSLLLVLLGTLMGPTQ